MVMSTMALLRGSGLRIRESDVGWSVANAREAHISMLRSIQRSCTTVKMESPTSSEMTVVILAVMLIVN